MSPFVDNFVKRGFRSTYCWCCHTEIDSDNSSDCAACGWLICYRCGACSQFGCISSVLSSPDERFAVRDYYASLPQNERPSKAEFPAWVVSASAELMQQQRQKYEEFLRNKRTEEERIRAEEERRRRDAIEQRRKMLESLKPVFDSLCPTLKKLPHIFHDSYGEGVSTDFRIIDDCDFRLSVSFLSRSGITIISLEEFSKHCSVK